MSKDPQQFPIKAAPKWSSILAVCKTCEDGKSSLPDRMKERMKERKVAGVRAVRSSCLDICPKHGVCATLIGENGTKTAIFHTDASADSVIDYLLEKP